MDRDSIWRRLTGVRGLAGLRRALLAAALLSLSLMAVTLLISPQSEERWDLLASVALATLGLRWWRLYATERPSVSLDLLEGGAVALLGVALGADNAMPVILAGLTFRSQYASRRRVLAGAGLYALAQVGATVLAHERFSDYSIIAAVMQVPMLLMVPGAAAELARGLAAIEAGLCRERSLALVVASYLDAAGLDELSARTVETICRVLGSRLSDWAVVLDEAALVDARERLAPDGAEVTELAVGQRGAVLVAHVRPLREPDRRWLATLTDQLALAVTAQAARSDAAAERIRKLVERTGGIALLVGPDLIVRSATPGARDLLGQAPEALIGRFVPDLLHRADRERAKEALEAGVAGDELAPERISIRLHGDEADRWVELSLADLRGDGTVTAFVVQLRDVTAHVALEEDVRRRDGHDSLTGLPSRERFERMVADELRSGNDRLAVALVDLDQFRVVNETFGHATGDAVLTEVGRRLAYAVAGAGSVARVAGDDFAILLPDFGHGAGVELVERVLRAFDRPLEAGSGTLRLSASAGVARAGKDLSTGRDLLAAADAALEAAHAEGPGRWTLYAPKHHAERLERALLQAELAEGIQAGQLELDYQPVVDAVTGVWRSAEALVRWRHPELGRLVPDRFIALAERTELIVALGEWVLHEACRQVAAWRAAGVVPDTFAVAVNVSGVQVARDDLVDHVRSALETSGLPPERLTLEITETAMIAGQDVAGHLERVRALGVRIAIDDFGTGHSSLANLKDLPADVVKLPRPFVREADRPGKGAAIIHGLVGLARPLGLQVLAEGVETRAQRDCVVAAGCELIQGYLFAAPMRPEQFAGLAGSACQAAAQRGVGLGDGADDDRERVGIADLAAPRGVL